MFVGVGTGHWDPTPRLSKSCYHQNSLQVETGIIVYITGNMYYVVYIKLTCWFS